MFVDHSVRNSFRSADVLVLEVTHPDCLAAGELPVSRILDSLWRIEYVLIVLIDTLDYIAVEVVQRLAYFRNADNVIPLAVAHEVGVLCT